MSQETAQVKMKMQYLGVLSLLARMSAQLDPERGEANEEIRETIEHALTDAQAIVPNLRWSRTHHEFTVWIAV